MVPFGLCCIWQIENSCHNYVAKERLMVKMINNGNKSGLSFLVLTLLATFLALGVFSSPSQAKPGDPDYKYPVLQEKDFQLYLKMMADISDKKDGEDFLSENNVSEEYVQAIAIKISLNAWSISAEKTDELEKIYGSSIAFNQSERVLFDKYEDQITVALGTVLENTDGN
jgi:hypothetical protein